MILMSHLRPPGGRGLRGGVLAAPGRRAPVPSFSASDVGLRRRHRGRGRAQAKVASPWRTATCCCWRTCASTSARRRTTPSFCAELAALGELYVNDAFGTAHRAHASTAGVAGLPALPMPATSCEREVATLTGMLDEPRRPFVAILGGSKVSDKIKVIDALLEKCRHPHHRRRHVLHVSGGARANPWAPRSWRPIGSSAPAP